MRRHCLALAFLLLSPTTSIAAPWPIDKVASLSDIGWREGLYPSPDGRWLAYTVEVPDVVKRVGDYTLTGVKVEGGSYRRQARITELATGKTVILANENAFSWSPTWSPKGHQLAYYSDQSGTPRLHLYDQSSGKSTAVEGVVAAPSFGFQTPKWSADGARIAIPCLPEGSPLVRESKQKGDPDVRSTVKKTIDPFVERWRPLSTAVIETRTGKARIVGEPHYLRYTQLSPDGKTLAYCYYVRDLPGAQSQVFSLRRVDLSTGLDTPVADELPLRYGSEWTWSPDSRTIAYMSDKARGGSWARCP